MASLIIEISPNEPNASACLPNGESCSTDEAISAALLDCCRSGDVEPACLYVKSLGVEFRIVARDATGKYENRLATAEEKTETARAIYFESETDFDDEDNAETYLIWDAANNFENESPED